MSSDFNLKIVLLGDSDSGKSSIIRRYCSNTFDNFKHPTVGAELFTKTVKVDKLVLKLMIWEVSGKLPYKSMATQYYRDACGIFLVIEDTDVRSWIEEIHRSKVNIPLFLLKSKRDLSEKKIKEVKIESFEVYPVSAKTGEGIDEVFDLMIRAIIKSFSDSVSQPKSRTNRKSLSKRDSIDESPPRKKCC